MSLSAKAQIDWALEDLGWDDSQVLMLRRGDELRVISPREHDSSWYHEARHAGRLIWQEFRYDRRALVAELAALMAAGWELNRG